MKEKTIFPDVIPQIEYELRAEIYELKRTLKNAERILDELGYKPCNAPACNCGGYHKYQPVTETDYKES